jgi:hypothetical protein
MPWGDLTFCLSAWAAKDKELRNPWCSPALPAQPGIAVFLPYDRDFADVVARKLSDAPVAFATNGHAQWMQY